MGLFDKMFGRGAETASQQPDAGKRFNELKKKYETVLTTADQQHVQFKNLHVQDNKLFIKGTAPTEEAKNKFWDQVKLVNPTQDDITAEISVDASRAQNIRDAVSATYGPIPLEVVVEYLRALPTVSTEGFTPGQSDSTMTCGSEESVSASPWCED